VIFQTEEITFN